MQISTSLKRREFSKTIQDALQASSVNELNIYNQAFLQLDRPLLRNSVQHPNTQFEYPVVFRIDGDFSGTIVCLLDGYNKNLSNEEEKIFKSLYTESMNILLGQMMTNLENHHELTAIISNPQIPTMELTKDLLEKSFGIENLTMGYKLISNLREFDCRIIFNINKERYSEA